MTEEIKSLLEDVKIKKRSLLLKKLKKDSGEEIKPNDIKNLKKEIARLLTKVNQNK